MQTITNKRAVIYCRVSTKEQVEDGNSLFSQEKICREYALKNGFEVIAAFIEQGESAKTADRTELQNLMQFCANKKNGVQTVIFYKIDRFARQHHDYGNLKYILLKRHGVSILSATEPIEDSPAGRFMENVIASVAQFDNDVRTERSVGGMRDAVRDGRYVWTAPIGYSNVRIGGKSTINPNEMAPLIKRAFYLVNAKLYTIEEIHRIVTKEGLITKRGKTVYTSHFHAILRNELYAGWITKFGERHKGTFEPIVPEALFQTVQHILKTGKRKFGCYQLENPDFPLRRFVQNNDLAPLTGCWSQGRLKKYPYYRFKGSPKSIKKETLESSFQSFLDLFRLDEKHYAEFKTLLKENLVKKTADRKSKITNLEKAIAILKDRQNMLIQKNLKGFIPDQILLQQLERIEGEIREHYLQLEESPANHYDFEKLLCSVAGFLKNPGETWLKASFEQQRRLQWFEFPLGVTFDGENFRTAKLRSIFKVKSLFLPKNSTRVPSKEIRSNNTKSANFPPLETKNKDGLWQQVGEDLIELHQIFNPSNTMDPETDSLPTSV